ncbi:MAG: hypothetical protein GF375_04285 [Candidatus Omnitrophica bacterium]|nr:hypothetical protein [Candidatus Omnitrophota bacterium]
MQKNLEERKRQTQPLPQVGEMEIKPVSREGKGPRQRQEEDNYRRKNKGKKKIGGNIDLLV